MAVANIPFMLLSSWSWICRVVSSLRYGTVTERPISQLPRAPKSPCCLGPCTRPILLLPSVAPASSHPRVLGPLHTWRQHRVAKMKTHPGPHRPRPNCNLTSCYLQPPSRHTLASLLSFSFFPKPAPLLRPPHLCETVPSRQVISFFLWETHSSFRTQPECHFFWSLTFSVTSAPAPGVAIPRSTGPRHMVTDLCVATVLRDLCAPSSRDC